MVDVLFYSGVGLPHQRAVERTENDSYNGVNYVRKSGKEAAELGL